ncbi:hypothetical protein CTE07_19620 [Chitinophaga terrae (ex Kim and Jung 2007)]|nr:hypothetical protein CTE07_19620 [Chitinophaga terrae (ex Kim and Jung 2007)]
MTWFFVKETYICNMKTKEKNTEKLVKVPQAGVLSLVADKIKNKVLFPEKVERIKQYLKNAEVAK